MAKTRRPSWPRAAFEFLHALSEAPLLFALAGVDAEMRQQPLLPQAMAIDTLLRRRAQVTLVIDRPFGGRVALQHAEFGEQFAHMHGLARRQRQVVGAPRVGDERRLAGARVAAELVFHVENQEVIHPALGQPPRGGEAGNAAADDHHAGPARLRRCREAAVAQAVAAGRRHAEQFAGRQRGACGRRATGEGGDPDGAEKIPAASQTSAATG